MLLLFSSVKEDFALIVSSSISAINCTSYFLFRNLDSVLDVFPHVNALRQKQTVSYMLLRSEHGIIHVQWPYVYSIYLPVLRI